MRRVAAALTATALAIPGLAAVTGVSPFAAATAQAAPGDPFDPATPSVFVAQGTPTQLFQAITGGSGETAFTPVGSATGVQYNAIAFNPADDYIYGISSADTAGVIPASSLVRIGQEGTVTRVGTTTFTNSVLGTFGPDDGYLYTYATVAGEQTLQVIDVATGALVRNTPITGDLVAGNDFAFYGGFLWSANGSAISRTNPTTGASTQFTNTFVANPAVQGTAGAAWTYGNGNLGFSFNSTGDIFQITIPNPAAATPTFQVVSSNPGPASDQNDGTAIPGLPTDLAIVKTGPAAFLPEGGTVTYTLTVTNNGPGNSSGFVVDDTLPAGLTDVASADDACTITGNDVSCVGGVLANGASVTYTITATVPAGTTSVVENTATVTSNEEDPTPGNDTSTTTAAPAGISILKEAGEPVDVNGNGITDAGDTIQFTFEVTNTGQTELTDVVVDDPLVGDVTCEATTLAADASTTCTADAVYTVTDADVESGSVDNSATATGTTPDGDPLTSTPSTTTTATEAPAPAITVVKSVDPSAEDDYVVGQELTYSFVVSNTGNVPLNDVTVVEGEFTGTGELSEVDCPATTLAVGAQMTCTATYTLTQADVDAGSVSNSATAEGTPTGSDTTVPSTPSETELPIVPAPGITVVKSADAEAIVAAGQVVTYSFVVENTGNVTLTDVGIDEAEFTGSGELSAAECPTTTLAPGEIVTCTATYTVTQADVDAGGELSNTATADGTTPGEEPIESTPSTETVPVEQAPALSVVKTADVEAAAVGQTVTYSFLVTNTGNVTITDPTVDEVEFSGTGELSAITCPAEDTLAPGDEITCTATYVATQADIDAGSLTNTATVSGTTPGGDPTDPSEPSTETVTTDPMPMLAVVKTADVEQITQVGQVVTYSFLVTNTGNVTITDPTVNEGEFSGRGELSSVTCPDGAATLAPGASVTCTATYTVVAADLAAGGGDLTNTATVSGTTPDGDPISSTPSTATVDTVTPAPAPSLPVTGVEIGAVGGALALLLLMLGAALLAVHRMRREQDATV